MRRSEEEEGKRKFLVFMHAKSPIVGNICASLRLVQSDGGQGRLIEEAVMGDTRSLTDSTL
jgi:ribosomal protein S27E